MQPIFWAAMALNLLMIGDAIIFTSQGLRWLLEKLQPLEKILPKIVYFILGSTVFFILINWLSRNSIINLSNIPFNLKQSDSFSKLPYFKRFIMEFVPLTFSLTPIVLFVLLFTWLRGFFDQIKLKTFAFILSAFFLVFMVAVIKEGLLVTVRYSIILFPLSMVLAAVGLVELFDKHKWEGKRNKALTLFVPAILLIGVLYISSLVQRHWFDGAAKKGFVNHVYGSWYGISFIIVAVAAITWLFFKFVPWKKIVRIPRVAVLGIFVVCNVISILLISPFYFSYTSELLPKAYIINGAWGYGGYEAAQYLNNLPNAKNKTLWVDVYGVCEFFVGKCIHKAKVNTEKYPIDYYFRSLQSTVPMNFPHPMEKTPVWQIHIDDRSDSFLKLNKARPVTDPSSNPDSSVLNNNAGDE